MALSETQQISELVNKSKSTLIVFKKDWSGDALAGSLALAQVLKKIDKQVTVVCQDFNVSSNLSFLPTDQISSELGNLQKFIISLDISQTQIGEFYYDKEKEKLNIYITPKRGKIKKENITTATSNYKYDLIFIINSPDLQSLGDIYEKNSDFFYTTPKINIDHSNKNEHFGDINLVNIASSSTTEIIYDLIKQIDIKSIDEDITTYVLTGIICATKNFKVANISPKTLNLASILVGSGARREQIIQNIYQNRYVSTLKLWGRVLTRLNNDLDDRLVWSSLTADDFVETSTTPSEVMGVIEELITSMPKTEIIVLLYEIRDNNSSHIGAIVYSVKNIDSLFIAKKFNPIGNHEIAKFSLENTPLAEVERQVINEVKDRIKNL